MLKHPSKMIFLFACLQVLCSTLLLKVPDFQSVNSLLFLVSGMAISYYVLQQPAIEIKSRPFFIKSDALRFGFILVLLPISYYLCRQIFDNTPIQKEYADMLPVMKVMGERAIAGEWHQVYDPIPEIWNGMQPIYLPAMWLPFTSSVILDFDMRWITVMGIWLSVLIIIWPLKWATRIHNILFFAVLVLLLGWLHEEKTNNVVRLTEEGVVFFYYALLTVSLLFRNPWMTGISIALCLLSRYALIGWLPFVLLLLLYKKQYPYLLKMAVSGGVVLLLLLFPVGTKPLLLHWQLPGSYIAQSAKVWKQNSEFFHQSLGMAKFFGPGNIHVLHNMLLIGSFVLPVLFFWLIRKKNISFHTALLSCFQLSLTFFYNFLDVSYLYLYYTPVFVSLIIAAYSLAGQRRSNED